MAGTGQADSFQWVGYKGMLAALIAIAAIAVLPASASAAPCPVNPGNSTAWIGGSGSFNVDANWSNGGPSGACDVSIAAAGTYTVTMTGGAAMKSLTLGGAGSTPTLVISAESPNTNLHATTTGVEIATGSSIVLTCPPSPGECLGGPSGGAGLNVGASTVSNAGTIEVDADSGTGATLSGNITNTGTIDIDQSAVHNSGLLLNQGAVTIADGKVLKSATEHCGSTGTVFKSDTGGTLSAEGTGTLDVVNYEQGNGTASGANPVQMPCGSLKFTGTGAGKVRAYGGFTLTGEMQAGQSLTVSAESSNTNAILGGNFTNKGSIALTCPGGGCSGGPTGGAGFNVNDKDFVNAGAFTVAAASGTGAGLGANFEGTIVNTGTLQFDQSAGLGGPVTNKGLIGIADGETATSSTSSCGDTGGSVKNDTGGQISAAGTGTLSAVNYEQGAGTTSGTAPVSVNCGFLKYTGAGASTVRVASSASLTGSIAAGQTVKVPGTLHSAPFANAGTIALEGGTVNTSALTNTGRLTGVGTVNGSVDNQSGAVAPGASPGTLTVNGNYTQSGGGLLEIEVAGTGAGEFDKLAVGGNATLNGILALQPVDGYADAAASGDSISLLTYGGTRTGTFGTTTVTPSLPCPRQIAPSYDDGGKAVKAVVSGTGVDCNPKPPPAPSPPKPPVAEPVPETELVSHPKAVVKTRKAKARVSFRFSATVAGATFQCKLDKGAFAACKSPKAYKAKPGRHRFQVRAVGPGGTDATPASFSFKVKKQPS